jgi:hypothetical protein
VFSQVIMVTLNNVNLRSEPNTQSSILMVIPKNTEVEVDNEKPGDWVNISYGGSNGYISGKLLAPSMDPYKKWNKLTYRTGDTPVCENISPKYDFESECDLTIKMMYSNDVVVKLMKMSSGGQECIRIAYVRGGESFVMKNIPVGKYYLKLAYGKDFRQYSLGGNCMVKFTKDAEYEKGSDILDFKHTIKGQYISYSSYEILLGTSKSSSDRQLNTNEIDEKSFNN